jgi:diguanylate cyclase (GGDEF)-like protein
MISLKHYIDGWDPHRCLAVDSREDEESKLSGPEIDSMTLASHLLYGEQWLEQVLRHLETNERQMKAIIDIIARTVQSIAERDERYAREVDDVAQRLRAIANLRDLARVRDAVVSRANSLSACIERMAEAGRESLRDLIREMKDNRSRLDRPADFFSDMAPPEVFAGAAEDPNRLPPAKQWAEQALLRLRADRRDLNEIVNVIGRAVDSFTERDEFQAREVADIAQRLRSIASLRDLSRVRQALVDSVGSLTACIERIAEGGRESLRQLVGEAGDCQSRLDSPERRSSRDLLTEFADQRRFEELLSAKIKAADRFCLIRIALNDLKEVNSRFGGIAGDDLIKQFALELRSQFPAADLVLRCAGDEFAVVIPTSCEDAEARIRRLRRVALGDYKVRGVAQSIVIGNDAAIGVVEWDGAENAQELLMRSRDSILPMRSGVS